MIEEQSYKLPILDCNKGLLHYFGHFFEEEKLDNVPLRFVVTKTDDKFYYCETGSLLKSARVAEKQTDSIFRFRRRKFESTNSFNAVLVVPTGIGAEIGGHAGDAGPVARMISSVCDNLILHPNVVNASDINEMTENTLYVEGSVLSRLLMGTIGLQKVRSNRILMVIDNHKLDVFVNAAINSINAARATYGLDCPEVIKLDPPIRMTASYSESGRAVGRIEGLDFLFKTLDDYDGRYDDDSAQSVPVIPGKVYH